MAQQVMAVGGRGQARPTPLRTWLVKHGPFTLSFIGLIALWEIAGRSLELLVLPPMSEIAAALWTFLLDGTLFENLVVSLVTLFAGMAIAIAVGAVIGGAMGLSRTVESALDVYVNAMMAAPMVAFVPLFILLFGLGYPTRIMTVIVFAIFPIIVNAFAGLRNVDRPAVEMARSFGASKAQLMWQVRIPSAFPYLLAGIRLGRMTRAMVCRRLAPSVALASSTSWLTSSRMGWMVRTTKGRPMKIMAMTMPAGV